MSELEFLNLAKFVKSFKNSVFDSLAERLNEFALDHVMCQFDATLTFGDLPDMGSLNETVMAKKISKYLGLTDDACDEVETFLRHLYQFTHDGKTMCPGALEHWTEAGFRLLESKSVNRDNFIKKFSSAEHKRFLRKLEVNVVTSAAIDDPLSTIDFTALTPVITIAVEMEIENLRANDVPKKKLEKLAKYLQEDDRNAYCDAMHKLGIPVVGFVNFFSMVMPNIPAILEHATNTGKDLGGAESINKVIEDRKGKGKKKFEPDSDLLKLMRSPHSGPTTRVEFDSLDQQYLALNIHYFEPISLENYATRLVANIMGGKLDPKDAEVKFNKFIENNLPGFIGKISLNLGPHTISIGFRDDLSPKEATAAISAARKLLRLN